MLRTHMLIVPLFVIGCAQAPLGQETKNPSPVMIPYEQIEFRRPIPIVAPQMAALWGDRDEGASGNEERQPAGAVSDLHIHPNDTFAVVIQGQMTHQFEGGPAAPILGPGSFYTLPAESPHISTCREGADCLIAYWQPGKLGYSKVKPSEKAPKPGQAIPASEVAFVEAEGKPAAALLWGSPQAGKSGVMERQAAGAAPMTRQYNSEAHGILVTGGASLSINSSPPQTLSTGSYFIIPEKAPLQTACTGPDECRFLLFFPGPVEP